LVITAMLLALAAIGSAYAWRRWGPPASSTEYAVTPAHITVTPRPAWIHADVKAEVLRSAAIQRLSVRDRDLVGHLSAAFAMHPWVCKVVRVGKQPPAAVMVELEYRRPVAAVEVAERGEAGLVFIDAHSVILPSSDFAPGQAKDYLRIAAGESATTSVYGTPWGNQRIAGAARLAEAWGQRWQPLGLYRIDATRSPTGELVYELKTRRGVRVVWGTAPGSESTQVPSAEQRIAALEQYIHDKGSLEREGGPALLDLRELASAGGRAAAEPAGKHR